MQSKNVSVAVISHWPFSVFDFWRVCVCVGGGGGGSFIDIWPLRETGDQCWPAVTTVDEGGPPGRERHLITDSVPPSMARVLFSVQQDLCVCEPYRPQAFPCFPCPLINVTEPRIVRKKRRKKLWTPHEHDSLWRQNYYRVFFSS